MTTTPSQALEPEHVADGGALPVRGAWPTATVLGAGGHADLVGGGDRLSATTVAAPASEHPHPVGRGEAVVVTGEQVG